jgi:hypothetical protein
MIGTVFPRADQDDVKKEEYIAFTVNRTALPPSDDQSIN